MRAALNFRELYAIVASMLWKGLGWAQPNRGGFVEIPEQDVFAH